MLIQREAELGTLPTLAVGTIAELPRPDGRTWRYHSVGTTTTEIAARLGWMQNNVWLREKERDDLLTRRGSIFPRLEAAISYVIVHPHAIHEARGDPNSVYFVIAAADLRQQGLLLSRSAVFVDAIIEARVAGDGAYLRIFHFSPSKRSKGGRKLWP